MFMAVSNISTLSQELFVTAYLLNAEIFYFILFCL